MYDIGIWTLFWQFVKVGLFTTFSVELLRAAVSKRRAL